MTGFYKKSTFVIAIIFVIFNVIVYAAPFKLNAVFIISYIFGTLSILCQIYIFKRAFSHGTSILSKFYGFPIVKIGFIYMITQMCVSIAMMTLSSFMPLWIALIVDVILAGIFIIGMIAADTVRDEVCRQEEYHKTNVELMMNIKAISASICKQCENKSFYKEIKKLDDLIKYSDPVSNDMSVNLENELLQLVKDLSEKVNTNELSNIAELCNKANVLLIRRNEVCKHNKFSKL